MINLATPEIWFVCGSQHLYGPGPLQRVAADARDIAGALADSPKLPLKTVAKPLLTTPDEIAKLCMEANSDDNCAGLILWMHTFSPSKMWIRGLNALQKPFLHLHTQFNRDLPWGTIDMDFMNLNQSAHGDREAGFIHSRMRLSRKVVVGHWSDPEVHDRIGAWMRAARAWRDWQGAKFCRFGDNMRQVAVTEGDKVAAEMKFGFATNGFGVGELAAAVGAVTDGQVKTLVGEYEARYQVAPELR
jgi:L-arabinose isomerase